MAKGKVKKIPPSRQRYEASHPTVTARVSKDTYDKLNEIRTTQGRSFTQLLLTGAGLLTPHLDTITLIAKAEQKGYQRGHRSALKGVPIGVCSVCHQPIIWDLTDAGDKGRLNGALRGWRHSRCSG